MGGFRKPSLLEAALMLLILGWTPVPGRSASLGFSACINRTIEMITCPGNQTLMYTVGDVASGAIANCGLPFYDASTASALNRTTVKLLHPNIVITNTTVIPLAARMTASMQYPLGVDVLDSVRWTQEPLREFNEEHPNGIREAWFMDPVLTADMADEPFSALQDMSQLVLRDKDLNWNGFGTFFRRFASVYDGKVVGLPVSAAIMLLYYRRDFFDAHDIPVPATWEELVDIAERYNGTDLDGTGRGAWGFCMSRQPKCYNGYTFQSIQVPFMQSEGTSQGFHFDPETMKPLVNSTGTRRAAELYRRLSRYTAPTEPVACLPVSLAFVWGNCLMAVGTTLHFKYATFNNSLNNVTRVRGKTGTAILPGSFEVMNRTTGQMVRCTPEICPHGKWHTLQNGTKAWVNAAPYAGRGAFTYALNRHREPHLQYMAYRLCARRVYADAMWPSVLSATAETTPVRSEMVDPANVGRYTAAGYDREDTLLFMRAVSDTMEHQNIALNLRIFGALEYYLAVDNASVALSDTNGDIDQILARAQAEVLRLYNNTSAEWLKQRYWRSIDQKLPPRAPPLEAPSGGMDSKARTGFALGVGVSGGLLLLGVAVVLVVVLRPAYISARQRKAYVPVASPECTLVVTDMEGSTTLWEAFPGDVMAAALQAHDAVVRRVLLRHRGYESATEGDSFILAFPNVLAALRFGMELQAELMAADWPPVLLTDSDICRPVYAAPRAAPKDGQTLFRRSGNLRPAATFRTPTTPPATPAAATSGFSHISSIAAAIANAAAVTAASGAGGGTTTATAANLAAAPATPTAGRTRSGGLQLRAPQSPPQPLPLPPYHHQQHLGGQMTRTSRQTLQYNPQHHSQQLYPQQQLLPPLQQQQQQQQQQLLEGQASLGPAMNLGTSLGEVPEQLFATASSVGSTGSLVGAAGMVPSGVLRAPSPQTSTAVVSGDDLGGPAATAAVQHQQHQQQLPGRARIPLLARCSPAARARSMPQAPSYWQQQPQHAQQPVRSWQRRGRPSIDDPWVGGQLAATLTAGGEPCSSIAGMSSQLSAVLTAGLSASGIRASGTVVGAAATPSRSGAVDGAAASGMMAAAAAGCGCSSGGGGGGSRTWAFGSEAASAWQVLEGHAPGAVTVYRGLRIRVGLHAGVQPGELARNRASVRITFSGLAIRMAKAVSDTANGGMVVLSDTSASQLLGCPELAALLAGEGTEVWHLGRVKLADDLRDVEMFQVVTPSLAPRLALQQPLRIKSQLLPGVLSAPAGCVALVRLHVSGLALLRASQPELAAEVGAVLEALLLQSLPALGGYLSEARQGGTEGISVAFPDCLRAVAWALAMQADMRDWDWSPELLQHEAFETIAVHAPSSFSQMLCGAEEQPTAAPSMAAAATASTAAAANSEIADRSTSKGSYPPLYNSPQAASTDCMSPAAVSFNFQPAAGPSIRPIAATATAATAAASGDGGHRGGDDGGGLLTSLRDRPPVSGTTDDHAGGVFRTGSFSLQSGWQLQPTRSANRDGATAASFSTRTPHPRSRRYRPWYPAARARVLDVESQAPSLLSPLQPPPERPRAAMAHGSVDVDAAAAAAATATAAPRMVHVLQIRLPSFMQRVQWTQERAAEEPAGGAGDEEACLCDPAAVEQGGRGEGGKEEGSRDLLESGEAAVGRTEDGQLHSGSRSTARAEMPRLAAALTPVTADGAVADATAAGTDAAATTAATAASTACTATAGSATETTLIPAADSDTHAAAAASATTAARVTAAAGIYMEGASPWCGDPVPVSPMAAAPAPAQRAAFGPSPAAAARARLLLATPGCIADSFPPPPSSTITASCMNPRGQVLFRGPRIKAVVDFGGVSTEICRTTGRLLYRGRMAKQLAKMMATAQRGQVLCTAAVYGQAGQVAPQVGISMALVAGIGSQAAGAGRRKPPAASTSRAPGVAIRPSSIEMAASGVAGQHAAPTTDLHDTTAGAVGKSTWQHYLCTLLAHRRVGMDVAPPPLAPTPPQPPLLSAALPPADAVRPFRSPAESSGIRAEPEL